jgi:LmbE family N-acetylglucosaminyl deacetylase
MTNGDGYKYGAMAGSHSLMIKPGYYINYGYRRQQETKSALKSLGVKNAHIITLGYPDRGLESMWDSHWNTPYKSPFTRDSASPYGNSYTLGAPYTGIQLLSDLKKVLKNIDPTDIYIPHPNDQHPDHWATSAFVTRALYDLEWLEKKNIGLYLIHSGNWPVPQGMHENVNLAPPAALADLDTKWYKYALDEDTITAKKHSIEAYRTQTGTLGRFLRSFVRENELFGIRTPMKAIPESSNIHVDKNTTDWINIDPVICDPINDNLPSHTQSGADLVGVYAAQDSKRLYFRISLRGTLSKSDVYELGLHLLDGSNNIINMTLRRGKSIPGWDIAYGKRDIELSCPISRFDDHPFMITVCTKARWLSIDRSACRILFL